MKLTSFLIGLVAVVIAPSAWADDKQDIAYVRIATSKGDIVLSLAPEAAPVTVANFLQYAEDGHYDRTIFHRVVNGFVIQGGGYSRYFNERSTRDPIPYEGDNGLKNVRGTIAMARTNRPNSAAAQWFINLRDNPKLDHRVTDLGPIYGYAVFGEVVDGMDVVDAIGAAPTGPGGPFDAEAPIEAIVINRIDPVEWSPPTTEEKTDSDNETPQP